MSTQISTSFVKKYENEVHQLFQKRGAILLPTVRFKPDVVGQDTTFQKIGKGAATTKARHGTITPMNQTHAAVTATLADFYAGDWVDSLDESKIGHDERMAVAQGGARALGRKVDSLITTALTGTTQSSVTFTVTSVAAVRNSLLSLVKALDDNDVPNDGQRYGALTPFGWAAAMTAKEFASADYVGANGLPFTAGAPINGFKDYLGVKWTVHTGLPGVGTASAECFVWHKFAVGYAAGKHAGNVTDNQAVAADITWHGDRAAHFVNNMMSGGAALIDDAGAIQFDLNDTTSLPTG